MKMKFKGFNACGSMADEIEYPSVLECLSDNKIAEFSPDEDGTFGVCEKCDSYFGGTLTKEQMLKLSEEIKDMANGNNKGEVEC